MSACFADTFYFIALVNRRDAAHQRVLEFAKSRRQLVTTGWVLAEVLDGLSEPLYRNRVVLMLDALARSPETLIIPASEELFTQGYTLYRRHEDKSWSLTDCISFVVMREQGLSDALTGDHHFEQAGFNALLK
jgi:predicted nucleic acid-binding protein